MLINMMGYECLMPGTKLALDSHRVPMNGTNFKLYKLGDTYYEEHVDGNYGSGSVSGVQRSSLRG